MSETPPCGYPPLTAWPTASLVGHHAGTTRKISVADGADLVDAGFFVLDFADKRGEFVVMDGYHNCHCAGSLAEHPGECGRTCYWDDADGNCPTCFCKCTVECGCPCVEPPA